MTRPLLYLDVDGPLNPYAAKPNRWPGAYELHEMMLPSWVEQCAGMEGSAA